MAKRAGTVGNILIQEILPEEFRRPDLVLDKKTLSGLLSNIAKKYPERYRDISFKLNQIGKESAFRSGGNSFGLKHLRKANAAVALQRDLQQSIAGILADDKLSDKQKESKIIELAGKLQEAQPELIFKESMDEKNPLAVQLIGAGRGNKLNLASLRGSDVLYQDHRGRIIPIPVLKSYSQGLTPAEYWAGTYGARQGVMMVKFATQDAGYFSKQLNQLAHRVLVTDVDDDKEPDTLIGLPVDTDDNDSEGALLAAPILNYKRNTVITPKILNDIKNNGIKRILVRSPAVRGSKDGGVYARDVGVREFNRLPVRGEFVGLTAAQALGEPLSQSQLSAKHTGGIAGAAKLLGGFDYIDQLVQVPKTFKGGAAHTTNDGMVQDISPAPAGGTYVTVDGIKHYVAAGFDLKVKKGDTVEAGDVLSEGVPNPSIITKYKGIGEGRRYFINAFKDAMVNSNIKANRRNIELISKGLIDHIRLTEESGEHSPDDIVSYSAFESSYTPRKGAVAVSPTAAVGRYLEKPYLHYTIGTKIKPSMLQNFKDFGIKEVVAHDDEPIFEPEMIRGMANLQHDPDFITRMFGSGLKESLLDAVHMGGKSTELGTSFVPGRARAVDFGRVGIIKPPKAPSVINNNSILNTNIKYEN